MCNIDHKGTLYIMRIQDEKLIREREGLKIFGVRFAKFLPEGWNRRINCTPSAELLSFCKELEKEQTYSPEKYPNLFISPEVHNYLIEHPVWCEHTFKKVYIPNFIFSIQNKKAQNELLEIANALDNGKDVYYACFCQNHKICHRRIIAAIFAKKGYRVELFPEPTKEI